MSARFSSCLLNHIIFLTLLAFYHFTTTIGTNTGSQNARLFQNTGKSRRSENNKSSSSNAQFSASSHQKIRKESISSFAPAQTSDVIDTNSATLVPEMLKETRFIDGFGEMPTVLATDSSSARSHTRKSLGMSEFSDGKVVKWKNVGVATDVGVSSWRDGIDERLEFNPNNHNVMQTLGRFHFSKSMAKDLVSTSAPARQQHRKIYETRRLGSDSVSTAITTVYAALAEEKDFFETNSNLPKPKSDSRSKILGVQTNSGAGTAVSPVDASLEISSLPFDSPGQQTGHFLPELQSSAYAIVSNNFDRSSAEKMQTKTSAIEEMFKFNSNTGNLAAAMESTQMSSSEIKEINKVFHANSHVNISIVSQKSEYLTKSSEFAVDPSKSHGSTKLDTPNDTMVAIWNETKAVDLEDYSSALSSKESTANEQRELVQSIAVESLLDINNTTESVQVHVTVAMPSDQNTELELGVESSLHNLVLSAISATDLTTIDSVASDSENRWSAKKNKTLQINTVWRTATAPESISENETSISKVSNALLGRSEYPVSSLESIETASSPGLSTMLLSSSQEATSPSTSITETETATVTRSPASSSLVSIEPSSSSTKARSTTALQTASSGPERSAWTPEESTSELMSSEPPSSSEETGTAMSSEETTVPVSIERLSSGWSASETSSIEVQTPTAGSNATVVATSSPETPVETSMSPMPSVTLIGPTAEAAGSSSWPAVSSSLAESYTSFAFSSSSAIDESTEPEESVSTSAEEFQESSSSLAVPTTFTSYSLVLSHANETSSGFIPAFRSTTQIVTPLTQSVVTWPPVTSKISAPSSSAYEARPTTNQESTEPEESVSTSAEEFQESSSSLAVPATFTSYSSVLSHANETWSALIPAFRSTSHKVALLPSSAQRSVTRPPVTSRISAPGTNAYEMLSTKTQEVTKPEESVSTSAEMVQKSSSSLAVPTTSRSESSSKPYAGDSNLSNNTFYDTGVSLVISERATQETVDMGLIETTKGRAPSSQSSTILSSNALILHLINGTRLSAGVEFTSMHVADSKTSVDNLGSISGLLTSTAYYGSGRSERYTTLNPTDPTLNRYTTYITGSEEARISLIPSTQEMDYSTNYSVFEKQTQIHKPVTNELVNENRTMPTTVYEKLITSNAFNSKTTESTSILLSTSSKPSYSGILNLTSATLPYAAKILGLNLSEMSILSDNRTEQIAWSKSAAPVLASSSQEQHGLTVVTADLKSMSLSSVMANLLTTASDRVERSQVIRSASSVTAGRGGVDLQIIDFQPRFDYTYGHSKVIVTVKNLLNTLGCENISCIFKDCGIQQCLGMDFSLNKSISQIYFRTPSSCSAGMLLPSLLLRTQNEAITIDFPYEFTYLTPPTSVIVNVLPSAANIAVSTSISVSISYFPPVDLLSDIVAFFIWNEGMKSIEATVKSFVLLPNQWNNTSNITEIEVMTPSGNSARSGTAVLTLYHRRYSKYQVSFSTFTFVDSSSPRVTQLQIIGGIPSTGILKVAINKKQTVAISISDIPVNALDIGCAAQIQEREANVTSTLFSSQSNTAAVSLVISPTSIVGLQSGFISFGLPMFGCNSSCCLDQSCNVLFACRAVKIACFVLEFLDDTLPSVISQSKSSG